MEPRLPPRDQSLNDFIYTCMKKYLAIIVAIMLLINVAVIVKRFMSESEPVVQQPANPLPPANQFEPLPPVQEEPKVEPKKEVVPEFVPVKTYRTSEKDTVYGDIISHTKGRPFGDAHGRSTNAHETAHGIHSDLRNEYQSKMGVRVNGFYALEGRGVIIEEPGIKMSHAVKFVPENLRSYRWNLYMVQQLRDWNDTPLYICDEWNAYVLGGMCGVDDVKKGKHKEGWSDGVSGCLDFSIITVGLAMAVKENDPNYWNSKPQFNNFVIWNLKRANETYLAGHRMEQFKWEKQDKLLKEFLFSESGEPMRRFIKEELEGVWLDQRTIDATKETVQYMPHQRQEGKGCSSCSKCKKQ